MYTVSITLTPKRVMEEQCTTVYKVYTYLYMYIHVYECGNTHVHVHMCNAALDGSHEEKNSNSCEHAQYIMICMM